MCDRNYLEEHLFVFLKYTAVSGFISVLNKEDKVWIHEEELATPDLTWHENQYKFLIKLWINSQMD